MGRAREEGGIAIAVVTVSMAVAASPAEAMVNRVSTAADNMAVSAAIIGTSADRTDSTIRAAPTDKTADLRPKA
jgi:hypothetical protein